VAVPTIAEWVYCGDGGGLLDSSCGSCKSLPLISLQTFANEDELVLQFFMNQKAKWAFYVWQGCLIVLVLFGACAAFAEGVVGYYKPYDNDVIDYNLASS